MLENHGAEVRPLTNHHVINAWIKEKTHGLITDVVTPISRNDLAVLVVRRIYILSKEISISPATVIISTLPGDRRLFTSKASGRRRSCRQTLGQDFSEHLEGRLTGFPA